MRRVEPPVVLGNVQALRAIAALLVVVVHAYAVESTYLPGRPWTTPYHILGTYGVDLFFVISGVVMLVSTATWFGERSAPRRFLARRATRIYPPYWIVTALVLVAYLLVPSAAGEHRSARPDVLLSFLALPQRGEPLLVVGWTLTYELVFYAVFAFALTFARRYLAVVTAIWLLAVVLIGALGPHANPLVRVLGSWFNLEFVFGMAVGTLVLRGAFAAPRALLALAIVLVVAVCVATAYSGREFLEIAWWRPWAVGLPMALLVYASLGLERRGVLAPRWLRAQGDASYALYLWHVPVIGALGLALNRIHVNGTPARVAIVFGGYALAIAVSFAAYRWIERPLLRLARRYFEGKATRVDRTAPASAALSAPRPADR
ncbi:MAG: exopolysaccharide production protein ExoZ [Candidatus Eremiobacteraeota bacterium]|nr:exopolysaccharide production protein ExoZ [Candidatus Eremiobacteraeota bacterium]